MERQGRGLPRWICGLDYATRILGRRWVLLLIRDLSMGPKRFNQLRRLPLDIPPKSLSRSLEFLELNGIVKRKVLPDSPPAVSYELVEEDPLLQEIIQKLSIWGNKKRGKPAIGPG